MFYLRSVFIIHVLVKISTVNRLEWFYKSRV